MTPIRIHAVVRLTEDVPSLVLRRGAEGVVVSVWLGPGDLFYEVEFPKSVESAAVRTLFRVQQLEVVE